MEIELDELPETCTLHDETSYQFSISPAIYNKLEKHLSLLRAIGRTSSKRNFLLQAIQDKLETEDLSVEIPKERRINFRISRIMFEQIDTRVDIMKKYRHTYSKKQWILEALYEKLEKDEKEAKNRLKELNGKKD